MCCYRFEVCASVFELNINTQVDLVSVWLVDLATINDSIVFFLLVIRRIQYKLLTHKCNENSVQQATNARVFAYRLVINSTWLRFWHFNWFFFFIDIFSTRHIFTATQCKLQEENNEKKKILQICLFLKLNSQLLG